MSGLELEVMFVNLGTIAHLFELNNMLFLAGQLGLFGQFILEFPKIHYPAYRRSAGGRNFH